MNDTEKLKSACIEKEISLHKKLGKTTDNMERYAILTAIIEIRDIIIDGEIWLEYVKEKEKR